MKKTVEAISAKQILSLNVKPVEISLNTKVKLSKKQIEVLHYLRENGGRINYFAYRNNVKAHVFIPANFNYKVSMPTFRKLIELGLIESVKSKGISRDKTYTLTDLGKSIQL